MDTEQHNTEPPAEVITLDVPILVQLVASFMILGGLWSLLEIVARFMHHQIHLDLGVLGLIIGVGLLGFQNGWRYCALVFLFVTLIFGLITILFFLNLEGPVPYLILGIRHGYLPKWMILPGATIGLLLTVGMIWVLFRPSTRQFFAIPKNENVIYEYQSSPLVLLGIVCYIAISATGMIVSSGISKNPEYQPPPVWTYGHENPVGSHLPPKSWKKEIDWHSL